MSPYNRSNRRPFLAGCAPFAVRSWTESAAGTPRPAVEIRGHVRGWLRVGTLAQYVTILRTLEYLQLACGKIGKIVKFKALVFVAISLATILLVPAHPQSLAGLSYDDRSSIELACINAKVEGPATYHACLNRQLRQFGSTSASTNTVGATSSPEPPVSDPTVLLPPIINMEAFTPPPPSISNPQILSLIQSLLLPPSASPVCAENGSCYGDISDRTGLPKTIPVQGYYRTDGTYVRGYYRSK